MYGKRSATLRTPDRQLRIREQLVRSPLKEKGNVKQAFPFSSTG